MLSEKKKGDVRSRLRRRRLTSAVPSRHSKRVTNLNGRSVVVVVLGFNDPERDG